MDKFYATFSCCGWEEKISYGDNEIFYLNERELAFDFQVLFRQDL